MRIKLIQNGFLGFNGEINVVSYVNAKDVNDAISRITVVQGWDKEWKYEIKALDARTVQIHHYKEPKNK